MLYAKIYRLFKWQERLEAKSPMNDWLGEAYDQLCDAIKELPHGSGIDYDWEYSVDKQGRLVLENAYTVYDEYGGRVGALPFKLIVKPSFDECGFDITIRGRFAGKNECYRDYLYDLFNNVD